MKPFLSTFAACLLSLLLYYFITSPASPPQPDHRPIIDSLNNRIAEHEKTIQLLRQQRDTIRDTIYRTRTIREQVPGHIATLPPNELLTTWDNLTNPTPPHTQLTADSLALTPLPRIRAGTTALIQAPLYEKEILLQQAEIANLDSQLVVKDSVINLKTHIITENETQLQKNAETARKLRKKLTLWQYTTSAVTAIALVLLIVK